MSFNFNPMQNLSNVQASAKSCAGGGGNTGYFKRGEKEEDAGIEFAKDVPNDSFEKEEIVDQIEEQSLWAIIKGLFLDFFEAIKNFFSK